MMTMKNKLFAIFAAFSLVLSPMQNVLAQPTTDLTTPGERTVTVGETTVRYILPTPPTLTLTPPAILQNSPSDARIYPLLERETAPFNGVLFNGPANAWLEAERLAVPRYLEEYRNAIQAQMVAWTYMELQQANLQLATEREEGRIRVISLERQISSIQRSSRRSVLRPVLLTGFIVLALCAVGTTTGFIVARNH